MANGFLIEVNHIWCPFAISISRNISVRVVASAMLKACSITPRFTSGLCGGCSVIDTPLSYKIDFWKGLSSECGTVFKSRLGERSCV